MVTMSTVTTLRRRARIRPVAATAIGALVLGTSWVAGLPGPASARTGHAAATIRTSVMSLPTVPPAAASTAASTPAATVTSSAVGVTMPLPAGTFTDLHDFGATSRLWAHWHTGTDLAAPCGTPVLAANAGTVIVETGQGWSGPWLVKVTAGSGNLTTWYGHMRGVTVASGQSVRPGEQIGVVGDLGNATGCHLHFEVHPTGGSMYADPVDPSLWLARYADAAPAAPAPSPTTRPARHPAAYAVPQGAVGQQRVKHPAAIVLPDLLGPQPEGAR